MNIDDLLRDALHDDRWALPVAPDTLSGVRRKRAKRQRTRAVGAALAAGSLVTGVALAATQLGGSQRSSLQVGASVPSSGCDVAPPATPIPGSTPAYPIRSARDWFMTKAQSDAFFHTYNEPSPGPDARVPSPQASGPLTDRLMAELVGAGVPGTETLQRDEANSGLRGAPELHGKLSDGRDLYVGRSKALFPTNLGGLFGDAEVKSESADVVEMVPDTGCAALLIPYPAQPGYPTSAGVEVITPDGYATGWNSQTIPLSQLKAWAYAAARWATAHPAG